MKGRILVGSSLVMLMAVLAAGIVTSLLMQARLMQEIETGMRSIVTSLVFGSSLEGNLQDEAERLSREANGLRVTIINPDGTLAGDSHVDLSQIPDDYNMFQREEMQEAMQGDVGISTRPSETINRTMMFAVVRAPSGHYVRVARPYSSTWEALITSIPAILVAAVCAYFISIPGAVQFANSILSPIHHFSDGLDRVMEGDARLDPESYPYEEIRSIARRINTLSADVADGLLRVDREHKRTNAILNSMQEGFVLLDTEGHVLLINKAACRVLNCYRPGGGQLLADVTTDQHLLAAVRDVQMTDVARHLEIRLAGGNIYEVAISAVKDNEGQGLVLLFTDVSEKHLTAQVRQDFFQSASHELKTPITSIRGFAELLQVDVELGEDKKKESAERILKEAKRMQSLIENILMISRLESGDIQFERSILDMEAIVAEHSEDARLIANDYEITLEYSGEPCQLYASRQEMDELVGNLLSNALKYNKLFGRIEVRLFHDVDNSIILSVFNTGDAIPSADTERIFDRFFRLDKGRSKAVGGTGLGLTIVKHIANRYGATAEVIPMQGVGNIFKVHFPPLREDHTDAFLPAQPGGQ